MPDEPNADNDTLSAAAPTDLDRVPESALHTAVELWGSFVQHIPFVVGASLSLLLTWLLASLVNNFGSRILGHWHKRESVKELILRLISILIWVLGLLLTAIILFPGLTPSRALGGLGLVSIAVGLAFKDIFENFFAGILILWRFPFEKGDFIECQDLVGEVEQVLVRMTYIRETSGELVVVPNSFLFKNPVTILTNQPFRRITIMTGIAYDQDVQSAVDVITESLTACETVDDSNPVQIFPKAFGSSSIDIEVSWWTESPPLAFRQSRAEVVTAIKTALDAAHIEIPFPYRTLTFKEPLPVQTNHTAS